MTLAERLMNEGEQRGMMKGLIEGERRGRSEGRNEGRKEGRKEGRNEGRKEEKFKVAKKLIASGADLNFIATLTELPLSEIENLSQD